MNYIELLYASIQPRAVPPVCGSEREAIVALNAVHLPKS